jgi:hypothetical protein
MHAGLSGRGRTRLQERETMFYFNPSGCTAVTVDLETNRRPTNIEVRMFTTFPYATWS